MDGARFETRDRFDGESRAPRPPGSSGMGAVRSLCRSPADRAASRRAVSDPLCEKMDCAVQGVYAVFRAGPDVAHRSDEWADRTSRVAGALESNIHAALQ